MSWLNNFFGSKEDGDIGENKKLSRLHRKITELLPDATEEELIKTACIAGLIARVAYIDFEIHKSEMESMKETLKKWTNLDNSLIFAIVTLAIDEIKDLSGLENHKYCHPLNEILQIDQKYQILESLFAIAASDGRADNEESEEIRLIGKGLRLEHKHFISARATVIKKLGALKD